MPRSTAPAKPSAPTASVLPAPRFATAWAALVYAVATLALGYPALAGKFLVNPNSDQYIVGYAFREFAAHSLKGGHGFPLWNPYLFGGVPYVAGMAGDIFYPTFLLRLLLPADVGMTWGFIIHVFFAGLFTYLFLRALGLGFWGALVGGLAYMMGGNVAGLVSPGHDGKLFVSALLPLALLLVHRGVRDGRAWAWGGLAITVTLGVLSPHPQLLQYLLLVCGAYALFIALSAPSSGGTALLKPLAIRRLVFAGTAIALGLLGGAVQFAPLLEYTPWSPRAGGAGWEHAISYSMPPEEMINFYLPHFSGILRSYWGRNGIHLHSEYIGAAVLLLAGLAFGTPSPRRRTVWFWTGTLVVATLWALGGYTPFFRLVYAIVPGTDYFRAPSTMLYVVSFCVAVLAGVGVERALAGLVRPRYLIAWVGAGLALALLATTGGLTNLAMTFASPQSLDRVDANAAALTGGAWRSFLFVAAIAGVLFALIRGALPARTAGALLAVVVALDLWTVERLYWQFSPRADALYASDAAVDYLKRIPQPGRVAPIALGNMTSTTRDTYLGSGEGKSSGFMIQRVRSVVGYHGNELGRYDQLVGWPSEEGDWPNRITSPNLRRLTNLRYLYTNVPQAQVPVPLAGVRLVAGPARNVAGNTVYLYEFPEDNPAAWVVPLAIKVPDDQVLGTLFDQRFDVRRAALFDPQTEVATQPVPPSLPEPTGVSARVTRWEPGYISFALDRPAPAGAALVVSENYYPGWVATVDGKPAAVGRADYVLIGVGLPAGARQVDLTFTSPRYQMGKMITLAVLAIALLALVGGVVLERRRREPPRDAAGGVGRAGGAAGSAPDGERVAS
ncbi:MAG: YfhO family protein [Gemmatimonadaceae bacterium]